MLLLLPMAGWAQLRLRTADVLSGAGADQTVMAQEEHLRYMQAVNPRLPWVEEIEFRSETDRFELRRQEYVARLNVNGLAEMARQRKLEQSEQAIETQRLRLYVHEALLRRYRTISEYQLSLRRQALQQQLQLVYSDQLEVWKKLATLSNNVDLEAIIKAEYERDALALQLSENEGYQQYLRLYLEACTPLARGDWQLDTAGFIGAEQIAGVVAGLPQTVLQNPELAEEQAKRAGLDAEMRLVQAQSSKVLDFVQLRYHSRLEGEFNRDFSLGFGFRLPFEGSSRLKMDRLKIEQHASNQDIRLLQIELSEEIALARNRVATISRRWQFARDLWGNNQAQFTLEQTQLAAVQGPITLLQARALQLKRELNMLDMEQELLEQYLKILDWSGLLSDLPLVNYLSVGLEGY